MSRTVTALFDSRSEAEAARVRLASRVEVESTRFLAKETAAAVDDLKLDPNQAKSYREALLRGDHLLVAKIARGEKPDAVIESLEAATGPVGDALPATQSPEARPESDDVTIVEPSEVSAEDTATSEVPNNSSTATTAVDTAAVDDPVPAESGGQSPAVEPVESQAIANGAVVEEVSSHEPDGLRIGERQVARGGAHLRAITREEPAEEQVALNEDRVEIENRPAERRLAEYEVEAGGLLKDRVFEVVEMREEPVVTKEIFVREEVIVRKTRHERSETIRDTVRRTGVEVEELPSS